MSSSGMNSSGMNNSIKEKLFYGSCVRTALSRSTLLQDSLSTCCTAILYLEHRHTLHNAQPFPYLLQKGAGGSEVQHASWRDGTARVQIHRTERGAPVRQGHQKGVMEKGEGP